MKKILLILCLFSLGCASNTTKKMTKQKVLIEDYKKHANKLLDYNNQKGGSKKIKKMALNLIKKAKPIMTNYKTKHPQCGNLMDTVMKKSKAMTRVSLEAIERDYHEGEALPKSPDECYDAKELIVHPATVVVVVNTFKNKLSKDNREQINDEIEEVIAHIDILE